MQLPYTHHRLCLAFQLAKVNHSTPTIDTSRPALVGTECRLATNQSFPDRSMHALRLGLRRCGWCRIWHLDRSRRVHVCNHGRGVDTTWKQNGRFHKTPNHKFMIPDNIYIFHTVLGTGQKTWVKAQNYSKRSLSGTPWPCLKLRCAGGREFVSSIPGRGNIVGWVFHPTRWLERFSLIWICLSFQILNLFRTLSSWGSIN